MRRTKLSRRQALAALSRGTVAAAAPFYFQKAKAHNKMNHAETKSYDVIVVGGSYAGLSAALQLARARRRVLILDTEKPRNRFAHASHGFFGQDGRAPHQMIADARKQVLSYPTVKFEGAAATHAAREGDGFTVTFGAGQTAQAKRLVLATGITDALPDIPGMKELWGTGVAHCPYCHGYEVADRNIAVLSGKEANLHQVLLLREWSQHVTLLTNGAHLTAEDGARLRERDITVVEGSVTRLIAKGKELEAIEFADGKRLPFGALFIAARWMLTSPLAEQLGCEIEQSPNGPLVKTDTFKESTVPGVYVAGDAARLFGNATLASADGVVAGGAAHQSLVFRKLP